MRFARKAEIVLACAVVPCALEVLPASTVLGLLKRVPRRNGQAFAPSRIAHHVDRLLMRAPWVWHYTCLRRATVMAALLRRDGRDADVVIGARRRSNGELEAHAWLRCGGEDPFLEHGDVRSYQPLRTPSIDKPHDP
ncbi:MAG: lasso peptide biosynthesis B2 protein [Gemmatimonadaceae bacterium]